jgi:hypothetical protein
MTSRSGALTPLCLICSVNDMVNVLPCAAWAYLNGGPVLTCAAFPGQRWLYGRHQTTDLVAQHLSPLCSFTPWRCSPPLRAESGVPAAG